MNRTTYRFRLASLAAALLLAALAGRAWAQMSMPDQHLIDGLEGPQFALTAKSGYLSTADGNSLYFWGYAHGIGEAQYVGPTLIVMAGDTVTVTLSNALPVPVSIVFPGQSGVSAQGGTPGLLTQEAHVGDPVTYTFTATAPGTYLYHSGTRPDLQIEMGLVGALIVRPMGFDPMDPETWTAYGHPDSAFDQEYLFLCTEMDERVHDEVEAQVRRGLVTLTVDTTTWFPVYWFLNGRTGPDTVAPPSVPYLPRQPYDCMPMCRPGEQLLMRMVGGGRDFHPFHHHGNHSRIIARDGRLLSSGEPGAGADLSQQVFTIPVVPGGTTDALWTWTGEKLGWDVYGHLPGDDPAPHEYLPDHGKPFPVALPPDQDLTFGMMYGGSPFLGTPGALPPGQGGFNPGNAFMYMWHSHAEKEICNNNLFPGGMLTMGMVIPWTSMPMPMPMP